MFDQNSSAPVQPPISTLPPVKLWTPGFIAGVTFLLGFPAGIVISSINWMRMNMNNKALTFLIGGAVGAFIFVLVIILLPGSIGNIIGLATNIGILFYLRRQMEQDIEIFKGLNNVKNAGQLGGCLIGLGMLVLFLILIFGISFVLAVLGVPIPE